MTNNTDTYNTLIDALLMRAVETETLLPVVLTAIRLEKPELIPDPTLEHITRALLALLGDPADSFTTELMDDIEFRADTTD
jgi:hypothetical protein